MSPSPPAAAAIIVPLPPYSLTCNLHRVGAGTLLHRIHDRRFGAIDFNPGKGSSRFAPFEIGGSFVPTAYAATSLECAIFEAIYHDIEPSAVFKSVLWSDLEKLLYSTVEVKRDVDLAKLFTADLMKWGIERNQLIDTPRSTYPQTRLWSSAIHAAGADVDGMIWTSRKYDEERAMMLFGDRVLLGDLSPVSSVDVTGDAGVLQLVYDLGSRAGIDIIR